VCHRHDQIHHWNCENDTEQRFQPDAW